MYVINLCNNGVHRKEEGQNQAKYNESLLIENQGLPEFFALIE